MDINALGTQYLSSAYVPLSASDTTLPGLTRPENYSGGGTGFEELLKRAQTSKTTPQQSGGAPSAALSGAVSKKPSIDKTDKLYGLCEDLETFLIKNLIKSMRDTVQKTKLIDTGFAGEMYEDMLYDEYAKTFSKNANFGFAEMAYRELAGLR